jgi:hypothetical protein
MFLCQTASASAGGGTTFLDLAALFDSLPAGLQRRLEAVTVARRPKTGRTAPAACNISPLVPRPPKLSHSAPLDSYSNRIYVHYRQSMCAIFLGQKTDAGTEIASAGAAAPGHGTKVRLRLRLRWSAGLHVHRPGAHHRAIGLQGSSAQSMKMCDGYEFSI